MAPRALALALLIGCVPDAEPSRAVPGQKSAALEGSLPAPTGVSATAASAASSGPVPSAAPSAVASATATEKELPPMEPDASGLRGKTIDWKYDGADVRDRSRAYELRVFLHEKALRATRALPLIVFLHGLNRDLIPHRWMGGGNEGDVRKILSALIESGALGPTVIAGPGSIEKDAVSGGASWAVLDHDKLVSQVVAEVGDLAKIDLERVVVMGHSGAGCSEKGGVIAPAAAEKPPYAIVSIDTCMAAPLATALGGAPERTNVVVTWQTATWERDFGFFRQVFEKARKAHPPADGVLRELDALPNLPKSHDATVKQTFDKWLPRLLPPP